MCIRVAHISQQEAMDIKTEKELLSLNYLLILLGSAWYSNGTVLTLKYDTVTKPSKRPDGKLTLIYDTNNNYVYKGKLVTKHIVISDCYESPISSTVFDITTRIHIYMQQ